MFPSTTAGNNGEVQVDLKMVFSFAVATASGNSALRISRNLRAPPETIGTTDLCLDCYQHGLWPTRNGQGIYKDTENFILV